MTITLHPLWSQILVRLRPLPESTGMIIRVDRNEWARTAEVVAVGPECRDVTVGDVVVVTALVGQQVGDDLLLPESAVLAFLDEDDHDASAHRHRIAAAHAGDLSDGVAAHAEA